MKRLLKKIIIKLTPPPFWRVPVILALGIFVGSGMYILFVSNTLSYLSDNPKTCVNCHVMTPQYATWSHGSHREVATCNDCHVPHTSFVSHYYFKAKDGLRHATIFTLRKEPQVIFIKEAGIKVVQENCIRCHNHLFDIKEASTYQVAHNGDRLCWECHRETPHGRVNSLSSVPGAKVPLPESPVPDWIKQISK